MIKRQGTKLHNLKERVFSKYDYNQPLFFYRYDIDSQRFKFSVNQYADTLHKRLRVFKHAAGALALTALKIRREELEQETNFLPLLEDDNNLNRKKLIVIKTVIKVIDYTIQGKIKKK